MTSNPKRIHFISIGGSLMHSLAIALKIDGDTISGSDDEIFEPSKTQLKKNGLLPETIGWNPDNISNDLDAVILGMHAQADNPELLKAQELGIKVYSAPEFIYEKSRNKQRIVVAGSHGKTTITAIIMHVLNYFGRDFDYALGASVPGFKNSVRLSDAPIIVIEGDEYPSSRIDLKPKFLNYHHHIGLISGISWDHINIYPTEEEYVKQFDLFADATPKAGSLVYCEEDPLASVIGNKDRADVNKLPYSTPTFMNDGKSFSLVDGSTQVPVQMIGRHNMQNINGAMKLVSKLAITEEEFYEAITSFKGAKNRLNLIAENDSSSFYLDYAHAPSKVIATTRALKELFPERDLVAVLELHTYSSLNKDFLENYSGTLKYANQVMIYFNPETVKNKKLEAMEEDFVAASFDHPSISVFTNTDELSYALNQISWENKTLVMMSSGTFNDFDIMKFAEKVVK